MNDDPGSRPGHDRERPQPRPPRQEPTGAETRFRDSAYTLELLSIFSAKDSGCDVLSRGNTGSATLVAEYSRSCRKCRDRRARARIHSQLRKPAQRSEQVRGGGRERWDREDGDGGPRTGDGEIFGGAVLSRWLSVTCTLRRFPTQARLVTRGREANTSKLGVRR